MTPGKISSLSDKDLQALSENVRSAAQADELLWFVALSFSQASAALATYLEPWEQGESSCASDLMRTTWQLHASGAALVAWFEVDQR